MNNKNNTNENEKIMKIKDFCIDSFAFKHSNPT